MADALDGQLHEGDDVSHAEQAILALLRQRGAMRQVEIAIALYGEKYGRHRTWITSALTKLNRGGLVEAVGKATGATWRAINKYENAIEP